MRRETPIHRGAIIGLGKIALTGHLPAYLDPRISSRARIVAAVESEQKSRENAAGLIPDVPVYATLRELLEHEKVDFIDICTPPSCHPEALEEGLENNLHLVCEKPLSSSVEEARRTAERLKERPDLVFMACHQYRYSPVWLRFKEFIEKDSGSARYLVQFDVFRTQADPGYYASHPNWRTERLMSGGGILADTGLHYIYLSAWMLGSPRSVTARTYNLTHREIGVEDTALVWLDFDSGVAAITLTWGADRRANSARLACRRGSLVYDGRTIEKHIGREKENILVPDASDKSHYVSLYVSLFEEFIQRIDSKQTSRDEVDGACRAVEILHAAYESARTGRSVALGMV
jgi:UDP-N-acetylglucosamine 3-dehydrogenase